MGGGARTRPSEESWEQAWGELRAAVTLGVLGLTGELARLELHLLAVV